MVREQLVYTVLDFVKMLKLILCFQQPLGRPAYSIPKSRIPCHFFQRGNCDRGANCSFMHAPPLASPKLPQLNSSLTRTSNNEDNTQACKDQNDSPCSDSTDMSSDSDVSFDVIVGDDQSSDYLGGADWFGRFNHSDVSFDVIVGDDQSSDYLGGADWFGRFNHLLCQIPTWSKIQKRYSTSENSLHRSSQSGMKRPLEQEAESKIRRIDEQPERKLRRLDINSPAATYAEMPTDDDDDDRQNGCTNYEGVLSSRFRGRIRLPKRNTSSATCHNDERRGSPDSCATHNMEPIHGRSNRERERGLGKRNGVNASHFYPSKRSTEFKRAKTGMEMKDNSTCSDFERPKPLSVLLKKKREAQAVGGK